MTAPTDLLLSMSATQLLQEASELTKRAEELEADIAKRRQKFEDGIAADEAKLGEARAEAAKKIAEAQRMMGGDAVPAARSRTRRTTVEPEAILRWLRSQGGEASASDIRAGLALDVSSNTLSNHMSSLVEQGLVTKTGERRGTKYKAA